TITTEILPAEGRRFHPAEGYHQQYLDKNPAGCPEPRTGSGTGPPSAAPCW
ncbi:peptide-methionine (S)-S-oxide reductase, partial [Streptomyces minutiscleroticus]|uniref:peptide-methionine (S)-S-oxide reductase n=1 Tax=Streptomyces minutiscleroticus TaxID=68238 RepID=UPI0033340D77